MEKELLKHYNNKSREITKFSDIRIKEMIEYYNKLLTNLK